MFTHLARPPTDDEVSVQFVCQSTGAPTPLGRLYFSPNAHDKGFAALVCRAALQEELFSFYCPERPVPPA